MKKLKKWALILLVLGLALALWRFAADRERAVARFVRHHQTQLTELAEGWLAAGTGDRRFKGVEVEGICPGEHPIVQFFYGGWGIVPSSTYYGFFYSPDDVPVSYQNSSAPVRPDGEDRWTWSGEGDNGGVVRKLADKWYYYEAWF